jgi:hypothetical protein
MTPEQEKAEALHSKCTAQLLQRLQAHLKYASSKSCSRRALASKKPL